MTRRFAAGVATGILISILSGVAAATYTDNTVAAGPSTTAPPAHGASSAATPIKQTSGAAGPGVAFAVFRGGDYTVTAINGNTITATTNGIALMAGRAITGTTDAPGTTSSQIITGTTAVPDIAGSQIVTATATGPGGAGGQFTMVGPGQIGVPSLSPLSTAPMTMTITVNAATVYSRADQPADLSDVQVGSVLQVEGTHTSDTAITASTIQIVLPQRLGVVTAVNGNTLAVTGFDARTYTIVGGADTVYHRAGQSAALSDIAVGSLISAEGTLSSDGLTLNALSVTIQLPNVAGKVTAVSGNTVTVQSPDGTSATVQLTDTTHYSAGPKASADKSSVVVGSFIMAEGTIAGDGSLTALQVTIGGGVACSASLSESTSASGGEVTVAAGPAC